MLLVGRTHESAMVRRHDPGRLIAAAAQAALAPLGCRRIGRSRSWLSDQRYWLVVIEFQPSGWAPGSYLNVGAMWLWRERKGLAFNHGHRIEGFVGFETPEQFTAAAGALADRAAAEVVRLRQTFSSIAAIYRHLARTPPATKWDTYHVAVAAGLAGDVAGARQYFRRLAACPASYDWEHGLKSAGAALETLLDDREQFQSAVAQIISRCRALNGLSSDEGALNDDPATGWRRYLQTAADS